MSTTLIAVIIGIVLVVSINPGTRLLMFTHDLLGGSSFNF